MRRTIITDLDGTLIEHKSYGSEDFFDAKLLPGVAKKIYQWILEDCFIIIVTGRKESLRPQTEEQLRTLRIPYDKLVMGLPRGARVLLNDRKPDSINDTAVAITVERNKGLEEIDI